MLVVAVVVGVLVLVDRDAMAVLVLVARLQRQDDPHGRDRNRDRLRRGHRFGQHGPGDECADERGSREDDLAAGRAEVSGTLDPEGDGCAVADGADGQCGCQLARADSPSARDDETEHDVAGPGDDALHQGHLLRRDLIDPGRHRVVDAPARTCTDDQQCARLHPDAWLEHQEDSGDREKCCRREQPATEVLAEHGGRQSDGGDQLEVQHQRCGGGGHLGESCDQQRRAERAAEHDGETERTPPCPEHLGTGSSADAQRCDGERRAEVHEPGQDERRHVAGEHRRGGSRRTEEHGCGETSEHPTGGHVLRLPCEPASSSPDAGHGCVLASTR